MSTLGAIVIIVLSMFFFFFLLFVLTNGILFSDLDFLLLFCFFIMARKAIDSRIHTLVKNGVQQKHRSFFVLVGDRGRDQVSKQI
jgi:hypothetical protein